MLPDVNGHPGDPDRLVVLVVGDDKGFDRPLASLGLGDVRRIVLDTAPPPAPASR
jgi:hypothetical protein